MKFFVLVIFLLSPFGANTQTCRAITDAKSGNADLYGRMWMFSRLWSPGQTLTISFLNGNEWQRLKVKQYATEWTKHANIRFLFVEKSNEVADIRVGFNFKNDSTSWSKIGKDALVVPPAHPTIHFGWIESGKTEGEIRRVILHEFGHLLGLQHELQSPASRHDWDKDALHQYYLKTAGWTQDQVDFNVLNKLDTDFFSDFDPLSIMAYSVAPGLNEQGVQIGFNTDLSDTDKKFIGILYPFNDYYLVCRAGKKDEGQRYLEANPLQRCWLTVEKVSGSQAVLSADVPVSPGTTAAFKSGQTGWTILIVEKQTGERLYAAHEYQSVNGGHIGGLQPGSKAETNVAQSYRVGSESCFWRTLRNVYLSSKKLSDGNWLWLENATAMKNNRLPKDAPFLLSIRTPPLAGYFCLLELRPDQTVVVYYPNALEATDNRQRLLLKGSTNLTYIRREKRVGGEIAETPAFVNLSLEPDQSGHTTFIGLISQVPRPLSDFLPAGHRANYVLWDGITPVDPWKIGPGFYQQNAPESKMQGPDWLPAGTWSVGRLEVDVD